MIVDHHIRNVYNQIISRNVGIKRQCEIMDKKILSSLYVTNDVKEDSSSTDMEDVAMVEEKNNVIEDESDNEDDGFIAL